MPQPHRNTGVMLSGGYRYSFNGMEKDDEVKGSGNSYTTEFRQYDPRVGRWLSLDPKENKFPNQSPYIAFDSNPIYFTDPSGGESEGDYYNAAGKHLGSDGIDDNKVYKADSKNSDGSFNNVQELLNPDGSSLGHDNFLKLSAKVLNEDYTPEGSKAVASAMYNYMSVKSTSPSEYINSNQSYASSTFESGANKSLGYAAVINAWTGGEDLSRGAIYWDGRDVLTNGTEHYRYRKAAYDDRQGIYIPSSVEIEVANFERATLEYYSSHGDLDYMLKAFKGLMHTEGLHTGIKLEQAGSLYTVTAAVGHSIFYSETPLDLPVGDIEGGEFNYVEKAIGAKEFFEIWRKYNSQ